MEHTEPLLALFGTDERVEPLQKVSAGALSFFYTANGLRRITWQGTELIRAVAWPIRDENWGTYPQQVLSETVCSTEGGGFEALLSFSVGDGRLVCELRIVANLAGDMALDLAMTPNGSPFATNRAGFTVLHPIKGIAGMPLQVTHADGGRQDTVFPKHIQPDQPVKEIAGLSYAIDGHAVDISFGGEVFEMEDQRNWSDASFKTYCVPLIHPFTYEIAHTMRQRLRIGFSGDAISNQGAQGAKVVRFAKSGQKALDIGIALETGWARTGYDHGLPMSHMLLRTSPNAADLPQLCAYARNAETVDLEIVLPDNMDVAEGLAQVALSLSTHGIAPKRVIALPRAYLDSHQPVGPWPSGPTPNELLPLLRAAFPNALVGGGMLTNFTELNRCRPDTKLCDYITHGLTPLVHAGDNMSVLETLETLPQIFASAEAIAPGKPYRLGLSSIGMRSNPYGAAVAQNPTQLRRTMAQVDPRHRGLFGAAFAVGVLAATQGSRVEAICLGAPHGPFGLRYAPAAYPQAGYDGTGRVIFPLYHVVRAVAAMAGHERLTVEGLPTGIAGYAAALDGKAQIVLANLSDRVQCVTLEQDVQIALLDEGSFDGATRHEDWLQTAPRREGASLSLPPFAVAFGEAAFFGNPSP